MDTYPNLALGILWIGIYKCGNISQENNSFHCFLQVSTYKAKNYNITISNSIFLDWIWIIPIRHLAQNSWQNLSKFFSLQMETTTEVNKCRTKRLIYKEYTLGTSMYYVSTKGGGGQPNAYVCLLGARGHNYVIIIWKKILNNLHNLPNLNKNSLLFLSKEFLFFSGTFFTWCS